jgi:anti-sigma regulatory factor (Ser/Thr protein kinase)
MEQASGVHERSAVSSEQRPMSAGGPDGRFSHEAFLYTGDDDFARGAAEFISGALAANESVLVAVRSERQKLLCDVLADDARRVLFSDIVTLGRNPARLIPAWLRFLEEYGSDGRGVHVLAETVWPGRTRAELSECRRYEALLNVAFGGGRAWRLMCPFDVGELDQEGVELARCTHPMLRVAGKSEASSTYVAVDEVRPFDGALPDPPADARALTFTVANLHELREFVAQSAHAAHLGAVRTENVRLAVNEIASNSVRHGGGAGTLRTWKADGVLVCEVSDGGHIVERLVGRLHPSPDQPGGRGLWLVNHLCDVVQIRSGARGTSVRVHMRVDAQGQDDGA